MVKIIVNIDRNENRATVIDEGRGIPFKKNAELENGLIH